MLISMKKARELLGNVVSLRTVYRWAKAGLIRFGRVGRRMLVDEDSVKALVRSAQQPAETKSARPRVGKRGRAGYLAYHRDYRVSGNASPRN